MRFNSGYCWSAQLFPRQSTLFAILMLGLGSMASASMSVQAVEERELLFAPFEGSPIEQVKDIVNPANTPALQSLHKCLALDGRHTLVGSAAGFAYVGVYAELTSKVPEFFILIQSAGDSCRHAVGVGDLNNRISRFVGEKKAVEFVKSKYQLLLKLDSKGTTEMLNNQTKPLRDGTDRERASSDNRCVLTKLEAKALLSLKVSHKCVINQRKPDFL